MTIYEYMGNLGYTKHSQYPNGFEKMHNDRKILMVFNYKEKTVSGSVGAMRLIKKQRDIDDIQEAYHIMLRDLEELTKIGLSVRS